MFKVDSVFLGKSLYEDEVCCAHATEKINNSSLYWLKLQKCWKCHVLIPSVVTLRSDKDSLRLCHQQLCRMRCLSQAGMMEGFAMDHAEHLQVLNPQLEMYPANSPTT